MSQFTEGYLEIFSTMVDIITSKEGGFFFGILTIVIIYIVLIYAVVKFIIWRKRKK